MRAAVWGVALALASGTALGQDAAKELTVEEEVHALVGTEYTNIPPMSPISPRLSCIDVGGALLTINGTNSRTWSLGDARCKGRSVLMLQKKVGTVDKYITWRIVDALLLPEHVQEFDPDRLDELMAFDNNQCEQVRRPVSSFVVLARFGNRQDIDWRTGVEKAWTFDIKTGRIVPLSTRRIVCWRYED